ncbi:MAG: group II intron reverse transcriptase/maturase [Thermoanaerobaculia bacterium]|nr:group II intron reverse transcriptase/maturase [Thermoanaerobaculia bacterium]
MSTASKPQGEAMYVVSAADRQWLLNEQKKLYRRSWNHPDYVFEKFWGLVTDLRNLRCAFSRVVGNRGRRTAGVDGVTALQILVSGPEPFLVELRQELRTGAFQPSPARRVLIPKAGRRGEYRPLGIPTVKDRVVQAALKNIMEPVFEADFYPLSTGFRPGTGAFAALERLRLFLSPRPQNRSVSNRQCAYQVAIEGDIKGCFDNIGHHGLMNRVRRRISDPKVNRLVVSFLKAGVLSEGRFLRTDSGSPQGGILSPLLANIALSVIEERHERHAWPRHKPTLLLDEGQIFRRALNHRQYDRRNKGKAVISPIRYADDFILLVSAPPGPDLMERAVETAYKEKEELAQVLRDTLGLELSPTKTLITPVTSPLRFLGHHVRVQNHRSYGWSSAVLIPKDRSQRLRESIKRLFRADSCSYSLEDRLTLLNRQLRGWGQYYRHARGAGEIFRELDRYAWHAIKRWLRKKHPNASMGALISRYGERKPGRKSVFWKDGSTKHFLLSRLHVGRFDLRRLRPAPFAETCMESPVRNERRTPGSDEGSLETVG